jgi:hypothetical protein
MRNFYPHTRLFRQQAQPSYSHFLSLATKLAIQEAKIKEKIKKGCKFVMALS